VLLNLWNYCLMKLPLDEECFDKFKTSLKICNPFFFVDPSFALCASIVSFWILSWLVLIEWLMMSLTLKQLVSKKRRRYKRDGFNLDLSYVTDNVIAMGFPSENVESIYRNSIDEVRRFLDEKHLNCYKVYNLCSERSYDVQKFHGRVAVYPFDDHSPPEFGLILPFCCDVAQWLAEDPEHVAVVHCKAGKGRTGLMICAFLLYSKLFSSAQEVLDYYGSMRTFDSNGVTIPSQRRYVDYFATKLSKGLHFEYNPVKMYLSSIVIQSPPHIGGFGHHTAHLQFEVLQHLVPPFTSEVYTCELSQDRIVLDVRPPLLICGDVKIVCSQKMNVDLLHLRSKPKFSSILHGKLFHFWINTFFIDLQYSTPLSHDLSVATGEEKLGVRFPSMTRLPMKSNPGTPAVNKRSLTRSAVSKKLFTPTPIRNRFAALSMPNLPAQFLGNDNEVNVANSAVCTVKRIEEECRDELGQKSSVMGIEMSVRLWKDQIDKASKDHTGKFPEGFAITLVVFKPDLSTVEGGASNDVPIVQDKMR